LRKTRNVQLNLRMRPEERREVEDLADALGLSFTDTLLDAVRFRMEALKADGEQ